MYGGKCSCLGCPVADATVLTLNHVQGDGHLRRTSRTNNQPEWVEAGRGHRPDIYEILCANCHLTKTKGLTCTWH